MFERIATDFVAFFVVVNPVGVAPMFIAVTWRESRENRNSIALRAVLISAVILIAFIIAGQLVLKALGIGVPSFRIAGGLVLFAISMKMILNEGPGPSPDTRTSPQDGAARDVAVFPLAMPFIAGPGAIMASVVLTDNEKFSLPEQAVTTAVLLAVLAVTYVMLLVSEPIQRVLRDTGTNVLTRVLGLILAALSVQIVLDGIRGSFALHS